MRKPSWLIPLLALVLGATRMVAASILSVQGGVVEYDGVRYPVFPGIATATPDAAGIRFSIAARNRPEAEELAEKITVFYRDKLIGGTAIKSKFTKSVSSECTVHMSANGKEKAGQGAGVLVTASAQEVGVQLMPLAVPLRLPYAKGTFSPDWNSLTAYRVPDWFRDAKFGIWAHWGPQCQPEAGDWYARNMYIEGHAQYAIHQKLYGHPSKFGFKDVINTWKAEHFDPERLLQLYQQAGAKYFVAMAVHHDNFDLWNSKHQPWNAVNLGPKQDLMAKWAAAARNAGLRFGVSVHARSAWTWYEVAQLSDTTGPYAGVPYDGNLTKADGRGLWWEGYDPQDLYAQYGHRPSPVAHDRKQARDRPGDQPSLEYCRKLYDRVQDLVDQHQPDLVYFDEYKLPLYGLNQLYGLSFIAGMYNSSMARHGGRNEAVVNTKSLTGSERNCLVWDLEVGVPREIQPAPWQVDACIGHWHYLKGVPYRSAARVIRALVDVVSKNGNLLLSIPLRGDGTPDEKELKILDEIRVWFAINGDAIYGTRPWRVFGEGPSLADKTPEIEKGGIPLFRREPFVAEDIRFTTKGDALYAISLAWPESGRLRIKSLATGAPGVASDIAEVRLLGSAEPLQFERNPEGLDLFLPANKPGEIAYAFRITGRR